MVFLIFWILFCLVAIIHRYISINKIAMFFAYKINTLQNSVNIINTVFEIIFVYSYAFLFPINSLNKFLNICDPSSGYIGIILNIAIIAFIYIISAFNSSSIFRKNAIIKIIIFVSGPAIDIIKFFNEYLFPL